jgi:hypothetical protein
MTELKQEDLIEKKDTTSVSTEEKIEETEVKPEVETIEQDPLKTELDRVQKSGRTEKEKAEFSLKKNAERVKSLGGDVASILDMDTSESDDDDDKPLTIGMLKKMQQESASKTALQQADEISNETERELVKYHLQNTIKSTGNSAEDLKLARSLVNAVKNAQIGEELARKPIAKTHSNASSANAKVDTEVKVELTEQEKLFLGKPFNLTREQIIKARQK